MLRLLQWIEVLHSTACLYDAHHAVHGLTAYLERLLTYIHTTKSCSSVGPLVVSLLVMSLGMVYHSSHTTAHLSALLVLGFLGQCAPTYPYVEGSGLLALLVVSIHLLALLDTGLLYWL